MPYFTRARAEANLRHLIPPRAVASPRTYPIRPGEPLRMTDRNQGGGNHWVVVGTRGGCGGLVLVLGGGSEQARRTHKAPASAPPCPLSLHRWEAFHVSFDNGGNQRR